MDFSKEDVVALTRALVRIDSCNPGPREGAIGDYIFDWFAALGAAVVRDEVLPGRNNIVAKLDGEIDDPALVYICHMDTVPFGDGWNTNPLEPVIEGDKMWGRGTSDMKGGLAAAMIAFRNILRSGKKPRHSFVVIASCDEEALMAGAEKALSSGYIKSTSWVVDAEPTDGFVKMAHKGKTWFQLTTKGRAAHASTPETGIDAIGAMAEIICQIRARMARLPVDPIMGPCTATFGLISGGSSFNAVADGCTMGIDMRLVPPTTNAQTIELVQAAVKSGLAAVPGAACDVEVTAERPVVEQHDDAALLMQMKRAVQQVTGKPAEMTFFPGYTDSAVAAAVTGNRNCMSYGPGIMRVTHKPNEYVMCSDIVRVARVLTRLAENVLLEGEGKPLGNL